MIIDNEKIPTNIWKEKMDKHNEEKQKLVEDICDLNAKNLNITDSLVNINLKKLNHKIENSIYLK